LGVGCEVEYLKKIREEGQKYGWGFMLIRKKEFEEFMGMLLKRFDKVRLLDVGAWKCFLYDYLKKCFVRVEYVGIDVVDLPDRVKEAEFYVMSPTYLLFPSNSFEAVVMLETLEHIIDYPLALREVYRVLKSGGGAFIQSVICYDNCALLDETHVHVLHPKTLGRLLRHIGFKEVKEFEGSTFCVYAFK